MVARKKRAVRKISMKRDDLQWRVSNSLLILVLGMMFLGHGAALWSEQPTTGLAVSPSSGGGDYRELPVAYMLVGSVLIVLAVSSLLLYRKKYSGAAPKSTAAFG
jgi:hypothetical protein